MPSITVPSGENRTLIDKDDDHDSYRIRVTGSDVRIAQVQDQRFTKSGNLYPKGTSFNLDNRAGVAVRCENVGSSQASIELDTVAPRDVVQEQADAGTVTVTDDGSFTTDVTDRAPREIGKARMQDASGVLIDPATDGAVNAVTAEVRGHDAAAENGTAVASGGSTSKALAADGAETLRGRVVRATTSYDVTVDWEDANGNVLFTDTVASAAAAGSETTVNEAAISPYCTVTVADAGAGSGAVTATYNLR